MAPMKIHVDDTTGKRIDAYLSSQLPELSRARIQALLKSGDILVNGSKTKPKNPVQAGDTITVNIPEAVSEEAIAEPIDIEVLYEDDDIIVVNKESGLVVHPAAGNQSGTLVNALLHHCHGKLAAEGGEGRPGIVHRLDKDTSGCIVVAKTDEAHRHLVAQFKARETKKQYIAVVQGSPIKHQDTIFTQIGRHPVNRLKMAVVNPGSGKPAITDYQWLGHDSTSDSSLIFCDIHTGRTHQIRVHMLHIGCPIIGDPIYAKPNRQKAQTGRLMLHARRLTISHPRTHERLTFRAPIPDSFLPWTDRFYSDALDSDTP
ncbi:RluA family pseudouridine synthase [Rubritalea tangerina]|uniref:Pseudouridine synthase n=1 Tax=Rubritalea tangerina TaxID=430798 RepID=A0ABW4ZD86_9BACT